jgi:hypothetical protein
MTTKLDALVAERVMGWTLADRVKCGWGSGPDVYITGDEARPTIQGFEPSTSIADAWQVLDRWTDWQLEKCGEAYECNIGPGHARHADKCVAICLAALRAVGVSEAEIQEAMR